MPAIRLLPFVLLLLTPLPLLALEPPVVQTLNLAPAAEVTLDLSKGEVKADTTACTPPPGATSCDLCRIIKYNLAVPAGKEKKQISCYVKEGGDICTPPPTTPTRCESVDYKEAWEHRFENNATLVTWGTAKTAPALEYLSDFASIDQVQRSLPGFTLAGFDETSAGDHFPTPQQITRSFQLEGGKNLDEDIRSSYLPFTGSGISSLTAPGAKPEDYGFTDLGAGLYSKDGTVISFAQNGDGTFAPVQDIDLTRARLDPGSFTSYTPGFQEAIKWGICGVLGDEQGCGTAAQLTAGLGFTPLGIAYLIEDDVNAIKRGDYLTAALITGGTVVGGVVLGKMVGFADAMIAESTLNKVLTWDPSATGFDMHYLWADPSKSTRILQQGESVAQIGVNDYGRPLLTDNMGGRFHLLPGEVGIPESLPKNQQFISRMLKPFFNTADIVAGPEGKYYSYQPFVENIQTKTNIQQTKADLALIGFITGDFDHDVFGLFPLLNRNMLRSGGSNLYYDFGNAKLYPMASYPFAAFNQGTKQYMLSKLEDMNSYWSGAAGRGQLEAAFQDAGPPLTETLTYRPNGPGRTFDEYYASLLERVRIGVNLTTDSLSP